MARKSFLSGLALFRIYRFQGLRALVLDVVVLCLIEGVELEFCGFKNCNLQFGVEDLLFRVFRGIETSNLRLPFKQDASTGVRDGA